MKGPYIALAQSLAASEVAKNYAKRILMQPICNLFRVASEHLMHMYPSTFLHS